VAGGHGLRRIRSAAVKLEGRSFQSSTVLFLLAKCTIAFMSSPNQRSHRNDICCCDEVAPDMPAVRACVDGVHAHGCVHVFLRLQGLRCSVASEAGRLLCVLFVRHSQVPADTVGGVLLYARNAVQRFHCSAAGRSAAMSSVWASGSGRLHRSLLPMLDPQRLLRGWRPAGNFDWPCKQHSSDVHAA